jgi:hypothetical protein
LVAAHTSLRKHTAALATKNCGLLRLRAAFCGRSYRSLNFGLCFRRRTSDPRTRHSRPSLNMSNVPRFLIRSNVSI